MHYTKATTAEPGTLFISQQGRIECGRDGHGGRYLNAAVAAGLVTAADGYTTPLDHWLPVSPEDVEAHQLACESCVTGRAA